MAPAKNLGPMLAQKLNLSNPKYFAVAQYFQKRFASDLVINSSLPAPLVDELLRWLLKDESAQGEALVLLLSQSQRLTSKQFLLVAQRLRTNPEALETFVEKKGIPTVKDLLAVLALDTTPRVASFAVHEPVTSKFAKLDATQQAQVLAQADLGARLHWASRHETLDGDLIAKIKQWLDTIRDKTEYDQCAYYLHELIETQQRYVDAFIAMNNEWLNSALATTRHVRSDEQQRAVVRLDKLNDRNMSDVATWVESTDAALLSLINNPRTHQHVLYEIAALLSTLKNDDAIRFDDGNGPKLLGSLETRFKSSVKSTVYDEYDDITDEPILEWLVRRCDTAKGSHARLHDARVLLRNANLLATQVNALRGRINDAERIYVEMVQWKINAWEKARNGPPMELLEPDMKKYETEISRRHYLNEAHTAYLHDHLGDEPGCWDAFFSLSENWDGTLTELLVTAKNLN